MPGNFLHLSTIVTLTGILSFAQTPSPVPAFEVASIKLAVPPGPGIRIHVGMKTDAARVDIGFMSLADIIAIAYRVKAHQISGPDWINSQRFDILATIPEGATREEVPEMLQALLAERFHLTMHRENKEHAVYALVVAKGGPKLKEPPPETEPPPANDAPKEGIAIGTPDGEVRVKQTSQGAVVTGGKNGTMKMSMGPNGMHLQAESITMSGLCEMLSRFVDRPVVDMTDLKEHYQVGLDISIEDLRGVARKVGIMGAGPGPGPAPTGQSAVNTPNRPGDAASDPSSGSIFTAIRELGLRIEPRKAPADTIVIDHLEKMPTEN